MAGSPLSRVRDHKPAVPPHEDSKRGRKPKGDRALTPAERQRQHRINEKVQQVLTEHHDYKGRLHDETSGGYTSAKIAKVVAARDRKELYGGERAVPKGAGPESYDKIDSTADSADSPKEQRYLRRIIRFPHNWALDQADKERLIDELAENIRSEERRVGSDPDFTSQLCGPGVS